VVIAGHRDAVERAVAVARERGATKALLLPVSIPAHSALMRPAATALAERLAAVPLCATLIPVCNVDLDYHGRPEDMRDALVRQLHSPVRWVETIRSMTRSGVTRCVELGPGRVLTGLNRRIERRGLQAMTAADPESLDQAVTSCWEKVDAG
jgi:[acyl-carrier-protein] S-malonyltransferase